MPIFTVGEVVDGYTFKVKEGWEWGNKKGDIVRPADYNTPEEDEPGHEEAKQKLKELILNKSVEIENPQTIDEWNRLVTDVYYKGKKLADYFPEYKT